MKTIWHAYKAGQYLCISLNLFEETLNRAEVDKCMGFSLALFDYSCSTVMSAFHKTAVVAEFSTNTLS